MGRLKDRTRVAQEGFNQLGSYCNEHEGGLGNWEFSISVDDIGGPLENGEEVTITVEYLFGTLLIVESI